MYSRILLPLSFVFLFCTTASYAADAPQAVLPEKHFALIEQYCLECHDALTEKGDINLEDLSFNIDTIQVAELWQKVLNSLNSGEMPPEKEPQIPPSKKADILDDLSHQMVTARDVLSDAGGMITMRRLNRREYENTIFDLLGVRIHAEDLPDDTNSDGFDTTGASLFFSADQFEQYLQLGRQAIDASLSLTKNPPKITTLKRESEIAVNARFEKIATKLKTNYDRGEAWKATEGKKTPQDFNFIDEFDVNFHHRLYTQQYASYRDYLDRPESANGVLLSRFFTGAVIETMKLPAKWPTGAYTLRVRIAALDDAPAHERFVEIGKIRQGAPAGELELLDCIQVTGTMSQPQILEFPITVDPTGSRDFGFRQRQTNNKEATRRLFIEHQRETGVGPPPSLWIDWIEINGPHNETWPPPHTNEIFFEGFDFWKKASQEGYARRILERFATRAFRIKPPSPSYLDKLTGLFTASIAGGQKFQDAIREPLAIILASPNFLYLSEPVPAAEKRELTDLEMAVRLSYFLWSAPPDETLYKVARNGQLKKYAILGAQTNRMLKDPKAAAFINAFAHQWLHMERLDFFQFDYRQFPEFDESVKEAARKEVYETIRLIINEGRPVSDLLKADHVVINDLLADYYGIPNVSGGHFRKVAVPADSPRGGLLGMAAIHAMGSDGNRSSPVERGAWVMRKLLDDPPPPAPANVPQLSRIQDKMLSPRELQVAHMEEPQCAQCHRKIDPIGYGLQNFDAAGKWRDTLLLQKVVKKKKKQEKVIHIDARGQLPSGTPFADYQELRTAVANEHPAFERGFTEALIEYALGRPYGFSDERLRENMLKRARSKDRSMRDFIHALIQSKPFRTKK